MPEQYELQKRPENNPPKLLSGEDPIRDPDSPSNYTTAMQSSAHSHPRRLHSTPELDGVKSQDEDLNTRTVRKLDYVLLPYLCLLFLLNALDRTNIGNAETANFTRDAGLEPSDLNLAVALFFIFFVILQPVGAAAGRKWGMATYVPTVMTLWGLCTAIHIWITKRWELISIRMFIGILEAGFYPTTVAYISLFYTRYEFARRLGFFYGQYALAGALGGVISYVVFKAFPTNDQTDGRDTTSEDARIRKWKSWQVLFALEGILTVIVAMIGFFWLPKQANSAWFLRADERNWADTRIAQERQGADAGRGQGYGVGVTEGYGHRSSFEQGHNMEQNADGIEEEQEGLLSGQQYDERSSVSHAGPPREAITFHKGLSTADVVDAVTDWKVWYLLVVNICSSVPSVAFTVFLPMIVKGLGFGSAKANLMMAPPFLCGFVVLLLFTWWSDKRKERIMPILCGLVINLIGLTGVVMLPSQAYLPRYLALCVLLSGSFVASPLTVAWLSGNMEEPGKRSVVLGINGWGNLAGVFSSLLFSPRYGPYYTTPFYITFCLVFFSFIGYSAFRWLLIQENRRREILLQHWTDEQVQKERRWGMGPEVRRQSRFSPSSWLAQLIARYRGRHEEPDPHTNARRGDGKITFVFGL